MVNKAREGNVLYKQYSSTFSREVGGEGWDLYKKKS